MLAGLAARMRERGLNVVVTREPGGTALGERLRTIFKTPDLAIDPLAEALIVNASRAQHMAELISPALAAGQWIVCDRFAAATLAYQGYGRGVPLKTLRELAEFATRGRFPDLTLLIDVPVEVSRRRVAARALQAAEAEDRLERESAGFHARVRDGYLELAREDPTIVTLDGILEPEALREVAWRAVVARFAL